VDGPERRAADRIVREKGALFPQAIREQGENDFLWKMFGSMEAVSLAIPLFLVVERDGRIQSLGRSTGCYSPDPQLI